MKRFFTAPLEYLLSRLSLRNSWRLYAWRIRFLVRYRSKVTIYSFASLDTLVRRNFELPLVTDSKKVDADIVAAVEAFLYDNVAPQGSTPSKYYRCLRDDDAAMNILCEWLRTQHWLEVLVPTNKKRVGAILSRHKYLFSRSLEPTNTSEVRRYAKTLKVGVRGQLLRFQESKARKIDMSQFGIEDIMPGPLAWVLTSTVACSGYIYATTYFTWFNIDPALYFTVPDYLAHSAGKIGHAILIPLAYILGAVNYSVRTPMLPQKLRARRMRGRNITWRVALTLWVVAAPVMFVGAPSNFYAYHLPVIVFPVLRYLQNRTLQMYFRNYGFYATIIGALVFFFVVIWGSARGDAYRVESQEQWPFVMETKEGRYDESTHRILGASSGYFFLLKGDQVVIMPKSAVECVTLQSTERIEGRIRDWLRGLVLRGGAEDGAVVLPAWAAEDGRRCREGSPKEDSIS